MHHFSAKPRSRLSRVKLAALEQNPPAAFLARLSGMYGLTVNIGGRLPVKIKVKISTDFH